MYTEEKIISECDKKNLDFKRIEYIQCDNRNRRCVIYSCRIHEKYGEQFKPVEKIFTIKTPCVYCNHSRLDLTLQDEIQEVSPNVLVIGKYINIDTPIECKCEIHDEIWKSRPSDLLKGKVGCKKCISIKKHNSKIKPIDMLKQEIKLVNPNIEFVGEYFGTHIMTDFRCLIHNKNFKSVPCNILNQTATCPICAKRNMQIKEGLNMDDLNNAIKKNKLQMEIIDTEYINRSTPIECRCLIHNIPYKTSPRNFLYKNSSGCPKCFQSAGENKLGILLKDMGFNVEPQYSFEDCKYINKLRFDYYDENKKIAFEYQGEQHYHPVNFGGISLDKAKEDFEINKKRDKIKKDYCKKNNIKLICVPYWEYNNMEHFLMQKI